MRLLKEDYTDVDLLTFLKTKLGLVDTKKVFKKEGSTNFDDLTEEAVNYLKNIKEGSIREFSTTRLNNAWLTTRGGSQVRRDLEIRLPAYIFMYFTDGSFVEGATKDSIKKYNGSKLDKNSISQKFSELEKGLDSLGLVNIFNVQNDNKKDGICVLLSLKNNSYVSAAQNVIKDTFTKDTNGVFAKVAKAFNNAFKKPESVDLKNYTIENSTKIQMYWTKEEENVAAAILAKINTKKTNTNKTQKNNTNNTQTTPTKKVAKKSFKRTFFGKQAQEFIKDPSKLQNFEDARAELSKDWNDKDAATVMSNVANIMKHTYTKSKAELTNRLRDMNLIEKVNKTKKLVEDKNDDLLSMFNFDLLENSVYLDKEELSYSDKNINDLFDLLNDVIPTYLGIDSLPKVYNVLNNSSDPKASYYKNLLDTALQNMKEVEFERLD